uniref:ATPase components of various ABC-type transport systems, contain duplicated ATPase n=1 Tax=uncultured delta proteobacterium HF0130_05G09 TaxID=710827 RepID=E0XXL6_9DELT|nr:ATPase components of various ABC-type transport systems, contain duplicated ATPase [uncultured delta proteobacterium HF0130_05G09]
MQKNKNLILSISNLTVTYPTEKNQINAVDNVNLKIFENEKIAIVGESGSGKTTLAMAILSLIKPPGKIISGDILFENINLLCLHKNELRKKRLNEFSLITQGSMNSLNPVKKIYFQLVDGMIDHEYKDKKSNLYKIKSVLKSVGLDEKVLNMYPHELSGGMKQRISIACSILLEPKLIIADEPTSALDVIVQRQVMQTLNNIQKNLKSSIILIGHDIGLVVQFADKIGVMHEGKLVEYDETFQITNNPKHWYTKLLIKSVPNFKTAKKNLKNTITKTDKNPIKIELKNIYKSYDKTLFKNYKKFSLKNINLTIDSSKPEIIGIAGQSGSGKSTLMQIILGTLEQTSGEVLFNGKPIKSFKKKINNNFLKYIQPIFQDPFGVYNPFYKSKHLLIETVNNLLMLKNSAESIDYIKNSMKDVGLDPEIFWERYPHQLSGGQRQRLMVARALMVKPKVILADEPVSMIDASLRASILENIKKLRDKHNITVLYITHDLTTAYQVCDKLHIMNEGEIVESGNCVDIIDNPKHDYTKLLIDSIPSMDINQNWIN